MIWEQSNSHPTLVHNLHWGINESKRFEESEENELHEQAKAQGFKVCNQCHLIQLTDQWSNKNHDGVPNTGIKGDVHDPVTWYCFHFKQVSMKDSGLLKV